jgi:hypothetical protein
MEKEKEENPRERVYLITIMNIDMIIKGGKPEQAEEYENACFGRDQ